MLSDCNLTSIGEGGNEPPDALDRVRSADLQPRFPQQPERATGTRNGQRAAVYYGTGDQPDAPAQSASTPSGDGFELNFENTPVTTVAKVVLGDFELGIYHRSTCQGTISLASGRPVPKRMCSSPEGPADQQRGFGARYGWISNSACRRSGW
jgi:general secretion pathway protein D